MGSAATVEAGHPIQQQQQQQHPKVITRGVSLDMDRLSLGCWVKGMQQQGGKKSLSNRAGASVSMQKRNGSEDSGGTFVGGGGVSSGGGGGRGGGLSPRRVFSAGLASCLSVTSSSELTPNQPQPRPRAPSFSYTRSPPTISTSSSTSSLSSSEAKETTSLRKDIDPATGCKMINGYVVFKELGRGMHGKVKLCVDGVTGEFCAIKIVEKQARKRFQTLSRLMSSNSNHYTNFPSSSSPSPSPSAGYHNVNGVIRNSSNPQLEKVKREIAILKKVNHENVVGLREVIDDPGAEKNLFSTGIHGWWRSQMAGSVGSS